MNLIQCYLTNNRCYTIGATIKPRGVMVHSTGKNNPKIARYVQPSPNAANRESLLATIGTNRYANDWNNSGESVCVHAFIGRLADNSVGAVQTLPWNRRGWHAGDGTSGKSANDTHIAFEICEDGLTDATYFARVYTKAVELTAMLCKKYGLDPLADGVVICHSEGHKRGIASNHADVMHWFPKFGKSMDTFRQDVAKAMGSSGSSSSSGGSIVKGSTVRVKQGAKTYGGGNLASFVYERDHMVSEVSGDRCVITYGGVVVAAVRMSDLTLVSGGGSANTGSTSKPAPTKEIVKGSIVRVKQGAKTYGGGNLASFVYERDHVVSEISGDRCVITYGGVVVAAVRKSDLTLVSGGSVSKPSGFTPYTVKVSVTELRIRSGPVTDTDSKGFIAPGVYTIVEEADGPGAKRWGKLKSGAGWISLDYTEKV